MTNYKIVALTLSLAAPLIALAGELEDPIIDSVAAAYGGNTLLNLSSYSVSEHFIAPTTGQGRTPNLQEIGHAKQLLIMDVANGKAAYETWGDGRGGAGQSATVSDGETAYAVDYGAGTYGAAGSADPYAFAGGTMRTSDTLLVRELIKSREEAKYVGDADYMNRDHAMLTMPFPQSAELTLYIDKETHLISKMVRVNPLFGNLDYVYSDYRQHNGITYAGSINFFIDGAPNLLSTRHELKFNIEINPEVFALPGGLEEEDERIDVSEILANRISDRVYHVGQGSGYSLFVDTSEGIVAAGGYPALTERLKHFQSVSDRHKPLRYQVVTHHHSDHLGGMAEAVALGARLVTVEENVATIKAATTPPPADWQFLKVGERTTLGEGKNRVEIFEVSTLHAASFLVTYVPAEKLVFIADHLGSPYKTGVPVANLSTVSMLAALEALDIDIDKIATAHNARIFAWKDLQASVAAYREVDCAADRPVCA